MTSTSHANHVQYDSLHSIVVSALLWRAIYLIFRLMLRRSPEYCCRIISTIHGCMMAFIGINQCFLIDWPFDHPEWRTNYVQSFLIVASLGYFIHDLVWCLYHQSETKLMIAHHVYCVVALARLLFKGYSGAQATCSLGCMEVSNPFLQARWFLRSEGLYPSVLYYSVEFTFFLVFVFVRIILGSVFLNWIVRQPKNDWEFVFMSLVIYIMSWMFLYTILQYVVAKYGFGNKVADLRNKGAS